MIKEIAVFDALLAPFEFMGPERLDKFRFLDFVTEDGIGMYTDDTQMTLAICEHMLDDAPFTQESYAEYFIEAYRRDPRNGYSKRTRNALSSPSPRVMLNKGIFGPCGNGTVMRCIPLGLYQNPAEVIGRAIVQSTATHLSLKATNACVITALTAHYIYHRWYSPASLLGFLEDQLGTGLVKDIISGGKTEGEISNDAVQTASFCIRVAAHIIDKNESVMSAATTAIHTGGDTDSIASITAGLVSLHPKYETRDEIFILLNKLDNGVCGGDYIEQIEKNILNKFKRQNAKV